VFSVLELLPSQVLALVALLADLDLAWLRAHPEAPPLYESGVRPSADGPPPETWLAAPWILAGHRPADCKALAAWRAAELRLRGEPAGVEVTRAADALGVVRYHLLVRRASGALEDCQAVLRARS
jgi:hypothetical protein